MERNGKTIIHLFNKFGVHVEISMRLGVSKSSSGSPIWFKTERNGKTVWHLL